MARETALNEIIESIGNLKAVLSLLYAVNVEAISQETLERVCLLTISLLETLEKGVDQL